MANNYASRSSFFVWCRSSPRTRIFEVLKIETCCAYWPIPVCAVTLISTFRHFCHYPNPTLNGFRKWKWATYFLWKFFFHRPPRSKSKVGLRKSLLGCGWVALLSTLLMCKIKGHRVAHVSGQGWDCIRVRVQSQSKLWKLLVCAVSVLTCLYGVVAVADWQCCDGLLH